MQNSKRPKIKPGYQVGRLTVTGTTKQRKSRYTVWRCTCQCGNTVLLDTRTLQRGTVRDCGCQTRVGPKQKDLTGQRFGRLVCLEPTGQRTTQGRILWRCQCDCGNTCLAASSQLLQGYKKSCGCLGLPQRKEYVGQRFGNLTVMEYAGIVNRRQTWRCQCDCGNETLVPQTSLENGHTRSCGCLRGSGLMDYLQITDGTSIAKLEQGRDKPISSNTSGYTGVYRNKKSGKWAAQITFKGKTYYLGAFSSIEEAVKARKRGEEMYDEFLEWYYAQHPQKAAK